MKGLVVSWFFPPATSAEGLVTFKLLKNSSFEYDVISAQSRQWSYDKDTVLQSPNIHSFPVKADSFSEFIREGTSLALKLCKENHYDFLMTRAMPPQSHEIGLRILRQNPKLYWIASMADPIGHNPYDYDRYFSRGVKGALKNPPLTAARLWIYSSNIRFDEKVTRQANLLIYPSMEQCRFTLRDNYKLYRNKVLIIPHSYDPDLMNDQPAETKKEGLSESKITIAHLGHLNGQRNAVGLIRAAARLKSTEPALAERLLIRLIGNIPADQKKLTEELGVSDMIRTEKPVNYFESLQIMEQSDMLLLIDAKFHFMDGNIFFASKLADYMGAGKSILGLTSLKGPSGTILSEAGCPVCDPEDEISIYLQLRDIAGVGVPQFRPEVYQRFESKTAASRFDKKLTDDLAPESRN